VGARGEKSTDAGDESLRPPIGRRRLPPPDDLSRYSNPKVASRKSPRALMASEPVGARFGRRCMEQQGPFPHLGGCTTAGPAAVWPRPGSAATAAKCKKCATVLASVTSTAPPTHKTLPHHEPAGATNVQKMSKTRRFMRPVGSCLSSRPPAKITLHATSRTLPFHLSLREADPSDRVLSACGLPAH
jgi:hypothetical protein